MTNLAILAVSRRGASLGTRLQVQLGGDLFIPPVLAENVGSGARLMSSGGIRETLADVFPRCRGIVLFLPLGAAVRLLAPLLEDKREDPGVTVVDEAGTHAICVLSGHIGGGNDLTNRVATAIGARPVITTASDVLGLPSLDLLGAEWGWHIEETGGVTGASAALVEGKPIGVYQDAGEEAWWKGLPESIRRYSSVEDLREATVAARLVISDRVLPIHHGMDVVYRPRTLVAGVGCVRGAAADEMQGLLENIFAAHGLSVRSLSCIATIDVKRDEEGLHDLAKRYRVPVHYFSAQELTMAGVPSGASEEVLRAVGAPGVSEPAAMLAAKADSLLVRKAKTSGATVAVARIVPRLPAGGHLAVVGIGPGPEELTERARVALMEAEEVVGYHAYLDQVRPWLGERVYHGSPIGEEMERCRLALSRRHAGARVALVSSGDAGIYGMAGLVFEILESEGNAGGAERIEVIAGVTASQAAASVLGAPLMSDFATISLSDLMIPWETIERRLDAVSSADMVVALYNPASARRRQQFERACEVLLRHRPPSTLVGIVRNAGRPGQQSRIMQLGSLSQEPIDMLTVVLVGNSETVCIGDRLVTHRGYQRRTSQVREV